jgi:hypothetical protein
MSRRDLFKQIEKLEKAVAAKRQKDIDDARVREATSDTYTWVRRYAKTYNEHWQEEGRPSPYEHFPDRDSYPHIPILFKVMDLERITFIEKSRDMMVSWACVAYFTRHAMTVPKRGVLIQCQKADKAARLVDYAQVSLPDSATVAAGCIPVDQTTSQAAETITGVRTWRIHYRHPRRRGPDS